MSFQATHQRRDGKVDVNLQFISGDTAVYHRRWTNPKGGEVISPWGGCSAERFNREFTPC